MIAAVKESSYIVVIYRGCCIGCAVTSFFELRMNSRSSRLLPARQFKLTVDATLTTLNLSFTLSQKRLFHSAPVYSIQFIHFLRHQMSLRYNCDIPCGIIYVDFLSLLF